MLQIDTENYGQLKVITIDNFTGEGTDDIRLEIDSKYGSAFIHLTNEEVKQLRDELDEWLDDKLY